MFTKSAEFYDAIYSWKDYAAESELTHRFIDQHKRSSGHTLLDVACGTGQHLQYLRETYQVEGLDIDAELLKIAARRCPGVPLHQADMVNFDLDQKFDAVTCLFSSIGYTKTVERLNSAMQSIARHLLIGGVAVVEPWFTPDQFEPRHVAARFIDLPDLKIARINVSRSVDGVSMLDFHYLIGTPQGIDYITETHELGLFTDAEYRAAFVDAGLDVTFDAEGLDGRGIYIGVKS